MCVMSVLSVYSAGGLILDNTVNDPQFEGMAVFTPIINGKSNSLGTQGLLSQVLKLNSAVEITSQIELLVMFLLTGLKCSASYIKVTMSACVKLDIYLLWQSGLS